MISKPRFRILPLIIAAALLFVNPVMARAAAPESRFLPPRQTQVSTAEEFCDWYQAGAAGGSNADCVLTGTVVIDGEMTLSASNDFLSIETSDYHIRVAAGGSLTVDNPNLYLSGGNQLIQVEGGAALHLNRAAEFAARKSPFVTVYLESGAMLEQSAGFPAGNIVREDNVDSAGPYAVTAINPLPVLCLTAGADASVAALPSEVTVTANLLQSSEDFRIGVQWDLGDKDLAIPGYYTLSGALSEEDLTANNLQNPQNLSASLRVLVRRPGPIQTLTASLMDAKDQTLFRFPTLPEDVEAVYLYQRAGNGDWEQCRYSGSGNTPESNFLGKISHYTPEDEFLFYHPVHTQPVSYRLEVVGSLYAGLSNIVTVAPSVIEIASTGELTGWYTDVKKGDSPSVCRLTADIRISGAVTLGQSLSDLYIDAGPYSLWVEDGGTLQINNPDLHFSATGPILRVESGGTVSLRQAYELRTSAGAAQVAVASDANWRCTDSTLDIVTASPEEALRTVSIIQSPSPAYLIAGEADEISASAQVTVKTEHGGVFPVGVEWDLSAVDRTRAGTYSAMGTLSSQDLARQALNVPDGVDVSLPVVVRRRGPIDSMTGKLVEISADGTMMVQLSLPELPEDVTAVYLYRRGASGDWVQCSAFPTDGTDGPSIQYNFLDEFVQEPLKPFRPICRFATDYHSVWLKVEIVGSIYAGFSNEIKITPPETAKPGETIRPPHDPDGDDSGGGRGGGGQGESDRPGMADADPTGGSATGAVGQAGQPNSGSPSNDTGTPNAAEPPDSADEAGKSSGPAGSAAAPEGQAAQSDSEALPSQGKPAQESADAAAGNGGDRGAIAAAASIAVIAGTAAILYGRGVYRRRKQSRQKSGRD